MDPELGGFPAGRGGNDKSLGGAAAPGAGKALEVLSPGTGGRLLLLEAPPPGKGGKELSEGKAGADGELNGGNPPELELSAGRAGRPELDGATGAEPGKPELSEGSGGIPGFELTLAPGIGGAELSLVKGGRPVDPGDGIVELPAKGTVPLSCPPGKGGNPPLDGATFASGIAFELELSVGKGGNPLVELASGTDEIFARRKQRRFLAKAAN